MDRRGFISTLFGGVAATAAVRTWPFRVLSFPKEIVVPNLEVPPAQLVDTINEVVRKYIVPRLADEVFRPSPLFARKVA